MRVIARSAGFVCIAAMFVFADAHDDVIAVVTDMAGALTEVNVPKFMSAFSKEMPGYATLQNEVTALVNQAEVSSLRMAMIKPAASIWIGCSKYGAWSRMAPSFAAAK